MSKKETIQMDYNTLYESFGNPFYDSFNPFRKFNIDTARKINRNHLDHFHLRYNPHLLHIGNLIVNNEEISVYVDGGEYKYIKLNEPIDPESSSCNQFYLRRS